MSDEVVYVCGGEKNLIEKQNDDSQKFPVQFNQDNAVKKYSSTVDSHISFGIFVAN